MTHTDRRYKFAASTLVLTAALASLVVAGCNQQGAQTAANTTTTAPPALPLTTAAEPASASAPTCAALPASAPVRVVHVADQSQAYAYADRAYRYAHVLADAPPDYTFDYDGVRPYVWDSNGAYQFAEPTSGGERYYYFDPGSDYPYLVRDTDYSYGYDQGQLVVIYDRSGRVMDPAFIDAHAEYAGRYLARARALRAAALGGQRQPVAVSGWAQRRSQIFADRSAWEQEQQRYPGWRDYDQSHGGEEDAYWAGVQQRRAAESQAYDQALSGGYHQGPNGLEVAGGVAALAAAAAIYNAGHQHHDNGPPRQVAPVPGPAPAQGFAGGQPNAGQRPGEMQRGGGVPGGFAAQGPQSQHMMQGGAANPQAASQQAAAEALAQQASSKQAGLQREAEIHAQQASAQQAAAQQAAARQAGLQRQAEIHAQQASAQQAAAQQASRQAGMERQAQFHAQQAGAQQAAAHQAQVHAEQAAGQQAAMQREAQVHGQQAAAAQQAAASQRAAAMAAQHAAHPPAPPAAEHPPAGRSPGEHEKRPGR